MLSYVVNYMPEAEGGATVVASHDLLVCIGVPLIGAHIRKAVAHHYIAITINFIDIVIISTTICLDL